MTYEATSRISLLDLPLPEVQREARGLFPSKARESTLMSRSGGEKGLRLSGARKLGVPLERDRYVRELFGLNQGCQLPFRISRGNMGFLLRRCRGKGPHLTMTGEPRGFSRVAVGSRVMTGNSGSLSCCPKDVQSPFELLGGAGDCSRITAEQIDLI